MVLHSASLEDVLVGLLILVRLMGDNQILLLDNQHRDYSVIDSEYNSWHKLGIGRMENGDAN